MKREDLRVRRQGLEPRTRGLRVGGFAYLPVTGNIAPYQIIRYFRRSRAILYRLMPNSTIDIRANMDLTCLRKAVYLVVAVRSGFPPEELLAARSSPEPRQWRRLSPPLQVAVARYLRWTWDVPACTWLGRRRGCL